MLYESRYNQYFLEHSWGPWKKHMYISREGESGKFTYKYPPEYYMKYGKRRTDKMYVNGNKWLEARQAGDTKKADALWEERRKIAQKNPTRDSEYYNEYYNTDVDKVINRSVKAAVKALNFGMDLKGKAEGYLNRFANAVSNAWNSAKSPDRTRVQAGKQFVSNLLDYTKGTVTAKRISASVQNLVKGASEAISKSWGRGKDTASKAAESAKDTLKKTRKKIGDRVGGSTGD